MYVLALGALVYLKYFGSFSFGEEKVDPKAKRGGRGGKGDSRGGMRMTLGWLGWRRRLR